MIKLQRIIITSAPVRFIVRKSKSWILPGFEGVPLYDVTRFFVRQMRTTGLTERASAIAYNLIMALPPAFLFLFTLIPKLPFISQRSIRTQLHTLIIDIVPSKVHNDNIIKFIDQFFSSPKIGLISAGFILSLFFASNAMMGIMRSFNKNYIGFEKRKGLHQRWMAIKLTFLLFTLVLGCLLMMITQGAALKFFGIRSFEVRQAIYFIRWIFIIGLIFYAFAFIYKYAPAVQKRWRLVSPGSILATTLSLLASLGFSAFVNNFSNYNVLYGAIGTVIVLMSLVFINSLVLLIGFELNVSIKSLRSIAEKRELEAKATDTVPAQ